MKNLFQSSRWIRLWLATFLIVFFGCEDDNIIYNHPHKALSDAQNYGELFESFWMQMSDNYLFWNIDQTNWDQVYKDYKDKFYNLPLGVQKDGFPDLQTQKKATEMFKEVTSNLIDGHFSIKGLDGNLNFTPSLDRWKKSSNYYKISEKYFSCTDRFSGICQFLDEDSILTAPESESKSLLGTIRNGKILYFSFRKFYQSKDFKHNASGRVINNFLQKIEEKPQQYKGLIMDVRSNTGGRVEDLDFLLSRFADKTSPNFFTRHKVGPARLSYGPWIPDITYYNNNQQLPDFPVVLLVDRNSLSMAEIAAIIFSKNSKTTVIGDRTYGALGRIEDASPYSNGGVYTIGNSPLDLKIYNPVAQLKAYDGKCYEGKGFPPEIAEKINLAYVNKRDSHGEIKSLSKDNQLERAVRFVLNRS